MVELKKRTSCIVLMFQRIFGTIFASNKHYDRLDIVGTIKLILNSKDDHVVCLTFPTFGLKDTFTIETTREQII